MTASLYPLPVFRYIYKVNFCK